MMSLAVATIGRRNLLGAGLMALSGMAAVRPAFAQAASDAGATAPIEQLDNALLGIMKSGGQSFDARYRALDPVVAQVFDLEAVLAASVGRSWATMSEEQKAALVPAFRRYTVSSYVSNFNSFNGQTFQVLPATRSVGADELVVQTHMLRANDSPLKLDYVMRRGPDGWKAVDVLTDGAISRVAVQRSDFRQLLASGGPPALLEGLGRKTANMAGGMVG